MNFCERAEVFQIEEHTEELLGVLIDNIKNPKSSLMQKRSLVAVSAVISLMGSQISKVREFILLTP